MAKRQAYVRYSARDVRLAARRNHEKTATFMEKYRYRAGVEATMSEYDRQTGVKKLRVRGMRAVRFAAVLKARGINIRRAAMCRKRRNRLNTPLVGPLYVIVLAFLDIKDHLMPNDASSVACQAKYARLSI
ncbi:hypothetical protein CSB45_14800 [candidate division KSB3 bacterium]|uniref:Transposase DDE domain-containing protein n=1 Tax=candidate division KSB3 bacterium TaxID=2044937 RepID=A0A2G6E0T8_9BACT|nr:MAG: hypothetical protein CSB45_14800 [candidate division KSB3 bacterium]PIE31092.1 MAG: hypothetical protein CSA57_00315 [candidate division KSB3 bacterium]